VFQSNIVVEGYDNNINDWYQISQLPSGRDGEGGWKKYTWALKIPSNVTKIRIALNARWVLDPANGEATTWFRFPGVYPVNAEAPDSIILRYDEKQNYLPTEEPIIFPENNYADT